TRIIIAPLECIDQRLGGAVLGFHLHPAAKCVPVAIFSQIEMRVVTGKDIDVAPGQKQSVNQRPSATATKQDIAGVIVNLDGVRFRYALRVLDRQAIPVWMRQRDKGPSLVGAARQLWAGLAFGRSRKIEWKTD